MILKIAESGHLFGNSCSFGVPYVLFVMSFLALVISHFRFEDRALVLIVSVPGHCLPFTFLTSIVPLY